MDRVARPRSAERARGLVHPISPAAQRAAAASSANFNKNSPASKVSATRGEVTHVRFGGAGSQICGDEMVPTCVCHRNYVQNFSACFMNTCMDVVVLISSTLVASRIQTRKARTSSKTLSILK